MQVCVTATKSKRLNKHQIKSVISVILVFLFVFISMIVLINLKKKDLVFEQQCFYLVYADTSRKESLLENEKKIVKNLGGAGSVYKSKDNFYLSVSVYIDINDAYDVKNNIISNFVSSDVYTIKTKSVSKSIKKRIKKNTQTYNLLKFMYEYIRDFYEIENDYLSGNITESKFLTELLGYKLELENKAKTKSIEDDISKIISEYGLLISLQLSNFLNNFYIETSKQSYICNYFVALITCYEEMYLSLN